MKKITSLFVVMFSCALVSAQEIHPADSVKTPWTFAAASKNIKFSPLDLFSTIPTLGADMEVSFTHNIRFQAGVGAVIPGFQFMSSSDGPYDRMGGYRLRAESRFYVFKKPTRYFATELSFRHLLIRDEIGIGMEPSTSNDEWGIPQQNFAYFVNTDMLFHRFNTNFNVKYGLQKVYPNGFVIDLYTGLSMRKVYTRTWTDIPEGGTIPRINNGFPWTLGDKLTRTYMTPIIGIKLGFVLK